MVAACLAKCYHPALSRGGWGWGAKLPSAVKGNAQVCVYSEAEAFVAVLQLNKLFTRVMLSQNNRAMPHSLYMR